MSRVIATDEPPHQPMPMTVSFSDAPTSVTCAVCGNSEPLDEKEEHREVSATCFGKWVRIETREANNKIF